MAQSTEISLLHFKRLHFGMAFLVCFTYLTLNQAGDEAA
jgi:hypothetical protein